MESAAGTGVPVVGIPVGALFAMQIGMDCHGIGGIERINERVRLSPFPFRIPPKRGKRCGKIGRRSRLRQGRIELVHSHIHVPVLMSYQKLLLIVVARQIATQSPPATAAGSYAPPLSVSQPVLKK